MPSATFVRDMRRPRVDSRTGASLLVYVVLLAFALFEQVGRTTSDTKTPLIVSPGAFLHQATTLWDPLTNFGELQNQAYGYLFPQGPFFLVTQALHVAPWVAERVWSVLVIAVAAEGLRLVARSIGLTPWAAWVAGMSYGLSPRILSEVGVRSAEILPTAALPWVVLPVVLAISGRLGPRRAALFSTAAFMFGGAVNGTATVAGLPLVLVLIVWGWRRGLVSRSLLGWWALLMAASSLWWAASLLRLQTYSPPFFDYVEDAKATTETSGYAAAVRGLSNWVDYTYLGNRPNWPAGYAYAYHPVLVLASGLLAVVGVLGLVFLPRPWRAPLVVASCIGMCCVTLGHTGPFESPLAHQVQDLMDGLFALLRNVSKAEPMIRLPFSLGIGAVFMRVAGARVRVPRRAAHLRVRPAALLPTGVAVGLLVTLVLSMAQPALALQTRTPGWRTVPSDWTQVADYLKKAPGEQRAWVVPGSGFALQTWGWTFDEPFQSVAKTPWVSRSQVPLTPAPTIRILSSLEHFLETGSGSPNLGEALGRLGIGYVLVRHDLDEQASDTTTSQLVSIALARSRGVKRVAIFGASDLGPAIEVYRVTSSDVAPDLDVRPLANTVTVASASSDVVQAVSDGILSQKQPTVVQGDDGWDHPADVVGDTYRDRERNFGRVHDSEGPVRARGEPLYGHRVVPDYPANQGSRPVRARYDSDAFATASSSQAWTNGLGAVAPQSAPYAAFDGNVSTGWESAYYQKADRQWLEVRWPTPHPIGKVVIQQPVDDSSAEVTRWRVSAGGHSALATVNPFTGQATAKLTGFSGRRLRIAVDRIKGPDRRPVSILEVSSDSTPYSRTLVLPRVAVTSTPSFVFTAQPETRACISTLLGPDCDAARKEPSEESTGIDRTFHVVHSGTWQLSGTAVARSTPATVSLLDPLGGGVIVHASSQWLSDPAVSARLAYDGATTTSWIADPRDAAPVLTVDFATPQNIDRLTVGAPSPPAVTPTSAVIRTAEGATRRVALGAYGQFQPVRTRHLTITFANPTRGDAPIGISELYLQPSRVTRPLVGITVTGAVCGLGPVLFVDGRRYETEVRGFMGDVVSAGPLHYESCSGPIRLDAGTHRFRLGSTEQFQPVAALLKGPQRTPSGVARTLSPAIGPVTHEVMKLGPGVDSMLSTTRNTNRGWKATLQGRELEPMVSDGWAQAWRVPAGKGGTVMISYAPQRPYLVLLYGGLGLAALVLLVAVVTLARTRLRPARPMPELRRAAPSRARWWACWILALPVTWLFGGVPALLGLALGGLGILLGRRRLVRLVATGCLVLAYVLTAWLLLDGPRQRVDAADLLAGVGFVLMVVSLAPTPLRGRPSRPAASP